MKLIEKSDLNAWLKKLLPKDKPKSINPHAIEAQHAELCSVLAEVQDNQDNPLGVPEGFHKVIGAVSGAQLGFGFYCGRCKLHVPGAAPATVRHCGTVSTRPTGRLELLKMKKYVPGRGALSRWRIFS